jgi:hypothetical protein
MYLLRIECENDFVMNSSNDWIFIFRGRVIFNISNLVENLRLFINYYTLYALN